jgi:hypothetical protein
VQQKRQSDEVAARSGLGGQVRYHRIYRMPPLGLTYFIVLSAALALAVLAGLQLLGVWLAVIPVAVIAAIAAYVLWPVRQGLRGVGVYDGGLVLLAAPQTAAVPWTEISRVVYMKGETHTTSSGAFSRTRTVHVEYAFTQLWLPGMTAPVALMHVWRHKRLVRSIQAGIKGTPVGGTAR